MPPPSSLHELLPWYATGTLDEREADEFREHLESCRSCREEMEAVREIRSEIDRHGPEFFEDHPEPEELVASVHGELDGEQAAAVRRHLALCAACATEASWIRGEAAAEGIASQIAAGPERSWGWAALAAAAGLAALLLLPLREPVSNMTGIVTPQLVVPTERGAAGTIEVEHGPGKPAIRLLFDLDLPGEAFPVTLEIRDEAGEVVFRSEGHARESLLNRQYLGFDCSRTDCPRGRYDVRIVGTGETPAESTFSFTVRDSAGS